MTNLEAMKKVIELIMENQESVKKMIELITMNPKAMKKVIELMDKDGTFKEATEIAREHEIALTEVWSMER